MVYYIIIIIEFSASSIINAHENKKCKKAENLAADDDNTKALESQGIR